MLPFCQILPMPDNKLAFPEGLLKTPDSSCWGSDGSTQKKAKERCRQKQWHLSIRTSAQWTSQGCQLEQPLCSHEEMASTSGCVAVKTV